MKIGIYGSGAGKIAKELEQKAFIIGQEIASKGHIVVTGACWGLPYEAVRGANSVKGQTIGYSPAQNIKHHKKLEYPPVDSFSKLVFVPKTYEHKDNFYVCLKYRNVSSCAAVDAAIFIAGRWGTLNEFSVIFDIGKNVGLLAGTGGAVDMIPKMIKLFKKDRGSKVVIKKDPVALVQAVVGL